MPLAWIAGRLNMGTRGHLAWLLQATGPEPARRPRQPTTAKNMTISLTHPFTSGPPQGEKLVKSTFTADAGRGKTALMKRNNSSREAGRLDNKLVIQTCLIS